MRVKSPTPIVRVSAPRAAPKKKHRRRRSTGVSLGGGGGAAAMRFDLVLGAAALGFAARQGLLEKIPRFFGMGPVTNFGLVTYGLEKFNVWKAPGIVRDAGLAARIIAGFEFGRGGTLVGGEWGQEHAQLPAGGGAIVYG